MKNSFINLEDINLTKQDKRIFTNFSLSIPFGEKINIFGKNGAGKTSLLKIISGITSPSSGKVLIDINMTINHDIFYIGHKYGLKNELSVSDNLRCILKFNQKAEAINHILEELNYYDMQDKLHNKVKYLSHGQKKIISLVQLPLLRNKIWLLDEPFTGLDQNIVDKLINKIDKHTSCGGTVIITSHNEKKQFTNIEL